MSFIRAKEIPPRSGRWYDYEVESVRKGDKVIQKHIRYIGKSTSHPSMGGSRVPATTSEQISTASTRIHKMKTDSHPQKTKRR